MERGEGQREKGRGPDPGRRIRGDGSALQSVRKENEYWREPGPAGSGAPGPSGVTGQLSADPAEGGRCPLW